MSRARTLIAKHPGASRAWEARKEAEDRKGLVGIYIYDLLNTGDDEFERERRKLDDEINMKKATEPPATFAGLQIERSELGGYNIHQMD